MTETPKFGDFGTHMREMVTFGNDGLGCKMAIRKKMVFWAKMCVIWRFCPYKRDIWLFWEGIKILIPSQNSHMSLLQGQNRHITHILAQNTIFFRIAILHPNPSFPKVTISLMCVPKSPNLGVSVIPKSPFCSCQWIF